MRATGTIITSYLRAWPTLPTMTLAKKIYAENRDLFTGVEHVRTAIRGYRGTAGKEKRMARYAGGEFFDQQYGIPETYAPDFEPAYIKEDNILLLADIHLPFHDPEAIEQAVSWGKRHDVNCVLLNGDTVDCYQLSRFIKDSRYPTLKQELDALNMFLSYLKAELPNAKIYWKNGNHEERLEAHMKIKNPELLDVVEWKFNELPQLRDLFRDIEYIADKRVIYAGKLPILHGHEFYSKTIGQVNPARTLYLKTFHSSMVAHSHITSEHTDKRLNGEIVTCWSVGCLCGLYPEYARINRWNHGFARIKVNIDGMYKVANIRIIDGKIY